MNSRSNSILIIKHIRWPIWHELPKSTILIADRFGLTKRIFSGFRSIHREKNWLIDIFKSDIPQWRTFNSGCDRKSKADNNCKANFRVKLSDTPRKFVLRNRSYKLYDNNSNTRHKWLRNVKCRFNLTEKKKCVSIFLFKSRIKLTYITIIINIMLIH